MERSKDDQFTQLAEQFPGLRGADGISPWNPNCLDIWATERSAEPMGLAAAQFLLSLWNRRYDWECGRFDVVAAFEIWDLPHRSAFLEWGGRENDRQRIARAA